MLPRMTDQFERFIAPARKNTGGWLLFGGICLLVVFYGQFSLVTLGAFALWFSDWQLYSLSSGWAGISDNLRNPNTPFSMIVVLTTFVGMFLAVVLSVRLMHDRNIRSLIGFGSVLRNFLIAAAALAVLMTVGTIVASISAELQPNLALSEWVIWLPLGLPLMFLQVSSEELVFRGYLLQELAVRFESRWVWLAAPAVVFGLLHFEPDKFGGNAWLVVVATSLFGLFATDVTVRTGNLGAAIGLHFANNFFAMFVTSMSGTLTGFSLFVTPFSVDQTDFVRKVLVLDILSILLVYAIYLVVLYVKQRRQLHSISVETM